MILFRPVAVGSFPNMWLIIDSLLGVLLGVILAWAYSAREAHLRLRRLHPNVRIPASLVVSRTLSIVIGVVVAMVSNVLIRVYHPSLLNVVAYLGCTLCVAILTWKFVLKPKTV